jgi:hypothetical protein
MSRAHPIPVIHLLENIIHFLPRFAGHDAA